MVDPSGSRCHSEVFKPRFFADAKKPKLDYMLEKPYTETTMVKLHIVTMLSVWTISRKDSIHGGL